MTLAVKKWGARNWTQIAKNLPRRIGKQCRERWHNHLDPNVIKRKWTAEEDIAIVKLHRKYGNRWCEIAKEIEGRTDNAVKNRFNSNLKKRLNEPRFARLFLDYGDLNKHKDSVSIDNVDGFDDPLPDNLKFQECERLTASDSEK